jgi:hypothetical protein
MIQDVTTEEKKRHSTRTAIFLYLHHYCKGQQKTANDIKKGIEIHFNLFITLPVIYYYLKNMAQEKEIKINGANRTKNNIPYLTYFADIQTGNIAKNKKNN